MEISRNGVLHAVILTNIIVLLTILWNPMTMKTKVDSNRQCHPPIVPVRESLGFFTVTAYCAGECCCGEYANGTTASGHVIQKGDKFCAADRMFPFHVLLDIEGYGVVPVEDRGGAIKGNKLDVFFPIHEEALEWGVQEIEVFCWVMQ